MDPHGDGHAENGRHDGDDTNGPLPKRPRPSPPISASEIRDEFSHHDPAVARINNGSFGSCPASVLAAQLRWQRLFLRQPDDFYFNRLQPSLLRSRVLIKDFINADDIDEVSLVDNATTAAAIVLQHVSWAFSEGHFNKGDAVVMLHYAFGAVKKSIQAYVTRAGGHVIEVPLPFPVTSNEEIVQEFCKALELGKSNGRKVRLAVIDHITSMPSVVIPVKELTKICREEGVDKVFVDAAHAIGSIEVDVKDIGADFYTSNLHKWFFCPPSVAFLYSKKSRASTNLHHPVVSHEYGNGLPIESGWIGTRDYSAQLVVSSVMDFIDRFEGGIEGIRKRNHDKVVEMGKMLAESWRTCLGSPPDMCASMIMVGLPGCLGISSEKDALKFRSLLRDRFHVEVPVYHRSPKDGESGSSAVTGYVRISHQVYNVEDDYIRLRNAINKLVQDGFHCTKLPSS
ncbi:putative L-cysteine desulfhydrase 1 [Phoenix dactylifera]|uniref:L-cysteine desulfhydrase 1 n=1 Tax=Phoenix dactylifera TaxID=42345 RepID=A0A8B7D0Z4_PHODC|nr:putative L-cysteine desulfhydrase 1 [Phoenix dactylifera]XP_026666211.2 putative L-cysteine desulfhydrase 1 [Phoenix dactylifera]XP_026666212.2 putative L-cysteine desulfhydrase 1 [Phoenix dactylifera]XP_026666213.2 putative L-cysteine desulfhydrase 1 [Phoenix dactylifera]